MGERERQRERQRETAQWARWGGTQSTLGLGQPTENQLQVMSAAAVRLSSGQITGRVLLNGAEKHFKKEKCTVHFIYVYKKDYTNQAFNM